MVDDPFADLASAVDDPFAALPRGAPSNRPNTAGTYLRDVARSIVATPVDVARLAGYLSGSTALSRWGNDANDWINRNISEEARFADDPLRASLQFGGSALIPMAGLAGPLSRGVTAGARAVLPAAVAASPTAQAVGAGALRAAELALPGSAPFTAGNVALNAGVGVGIGAGIEAWQDNIEADRTARNAPPPVTLPEGITDPFADLPADKSLSERGYDAVPWVVAGVGVLSTAAAARAAMRYASQQQAAMSGNSLVQAGTPDSAAPMTGIAERVENGIFNHNAILMNRANEGVRAGRYRQDVADDIVGTVQTASNDAITSDVLRVFQDTGRLPDGSQTHSMRQMMEEVTQLRGRNVAPDVLDPTKQRDDYTRFGDLLAAADELDVRMANVRAGKWATNAAGQPTPGVAARNALRDVDDVTLRRRVAEARRDPGIARLETQYRGINNTMLDYMQRRGVLSAQEVANMRSMGPNYMHRYIADQVLQRQDRATLSPIKSGTEDNSPLVKRDRGENKGPERYQDPMLSMQDGMRQTLDFIRRNDSISTVARFMAEQNNQPKLRGIGRVLRDTSKTVIRDGYVPVAFRQNGERYVLEVAPEISAGLLPYPRAHMPILNTMRMLEQQLTTGPLGVIAGNIQAPASALMGGVGALINAPKNMRLGFVDKLIYQYTGGRVNLRAVGAVDPTFFAHMGYRIGADMLAETSKAISSALQRSMAKDGIMASAIDTLGQGRAQRAADAFLRHYLNSNLHQMRQTGLFSHGLAYGAEGGGLTNFAAELNNLRQMSPEYAATINYQGFAKDIKDVRSFEQFRENIAANAARVGGNVPMATLTRSWQAYSKLLDIVANSPQSAMFAANVNNPALSTNALVGRARSVTGDPAQYGGYRLAQNLLSAIPFGNITLQANHQLYRSFKREPVGTTMRIASLGTMMSLAMLQSAIFADEQAIADGREPDAVAHMLTRDSRDAASAFRFYLPGSDGESSVRIPIEQSMAPFISATLGALTELFDVDNPAFFTGRYAPLRDSIHQLIEDGENQRMSAAFGVAGGDVPVLGAIDGAARMLTGTRVENALNFATGMRTEQVRDADGFDRTLINNDVTDRYTATALETTFGFAGNSAQDILRTIGMSYRATGSARSALSAAAEQYTLNLGGGARIVAPALFGQERRLRNNDIVGETVREMTQKLDDITRNLSHARGGEGSIGPSGRLREAPQGGGRGPLDPEMQVMLQRMAALNRSIAKPLEERTDLLTTLRSYQGSPQLRADPARLRSETNAVAQRIRELNAQIYTHLTQAEADLSDETGRRIRIATLDPLKGLDQFAPLPGR